jgi:hypothetical protein
MGACSQRLIAVCLIFWSCSISASETYIQQLITEGRIRKLWTHRNWQVLVHYSPRIIGNNVTSLIDDQHFFVSPNGKFSPQAELEATLRILFKSETDPNKALACRFPARVAWLIRELAIKEQQLPSFRCLKLENWLNNINAAGVTLVFPVSVLNSPASMFGHTFLRFDRKGKKWPDLLAWTVSYAARSDRERGVGFALKGLLGGYQGWFSMAPYYERVKEYSDIESRDIWEYQLAFNENEVHSLLLHLWELLPVYSNYYFIDENCAFQLLTLLQAARSSLDLTSQFRWDAAPADTVRAVTEIPGLLKKVNFRPSARQNIVVRASQLTRDEQNMARRIVLGEINIDNNHFSNRNLQIKTQILELAYDYAAYLESANKKNRPQLNFGLSLQHIQRRPILHQLLTARSQLSLKHQQPEIIPPHFRPDQGHSGHRIGFRYGLENPLQFLQLDFRWVYHDAFDPSSGYIKGAQLEFFKPAIRFYLNKQRVQFEGIDLVNIISTPAYNNFIQPLSWEVSVAVKRYRFNEDHRPLMGDFKVGLGISYLLWEETLVSFFANLNAKISSEFNQYIGLAGGSRMEVNTALTENWQIGFYGGIMRYFQGITQTGFRYGIKQRISLNKNNVVLINFGKTREFGRPFFTAGLSWQFYF